MFTLYGSNGSGSAAVEMALLLAGQPYRVVRASTWEPDSAQAELRQVNPLGQIPTLVDPSGLVVTESAAILAHLGLVYPGSGLVPAEAAARARVLCGLAFIAANCYAAIGVIDYPERWLPDGAPAERERLRQGARLRLHACWTVFAQQFAPQGEHLLGPAPCALDLLAAVVSRWSGSRAHLQAQHPDMVRALLRTEAHPLLVPVFARHWPPAAA